MDAAVSDRRLTRAIGPALSRPLALPARYSDR
jgi:hypothetical protein